MESMKSLLLIGASLWTAPTVAAQPLRDLNPRTGESSYPSHFTSLGDRALFVADDGITGRELWATDGTSSGTVRVTNFQGAGHGVPFAHTKPFPFDGRALVSLDNGTGAELWITDGTAPGTRLVADLYSGRPGSHPEPMIEWRGQVYFLAGPATNRNLYVTDGTALGTRALTSGVNVHSSLPVAHGTQLFFVAESASQGRELWSTDGTRSGTRIYLDLNPGPASGLHALEAASLGNYLYFAGDQTGSNREVWRTTGSPANTSLFVDLFPPAGSLPANFQRVGQRLVFAARTQVSPWQYFGTDGTTVEQLTFEPNYTFRNHQLVSNNQRLIGKLGSTSLQEIVMFATDGTRAGTRIIQRIPAGSQGTSVQLFRVSSGDKVVFSAASGAFGNELFISDGTAGGTGLLRDLNPGPASSNPGALTRVGDFLLFSAFDIATGFELYTLPWSIVDDWLAEPFGRGCEGAGGVIPTLVATGSARVGSALTLEIERAARSAPVLHFWSDRYARTSFGACSTYLGSPRFLTATFTDAFGQTSLTSNVPNQPSLVGLPVWIQSLVVEPLGGFQGVGALTSALEIRIGN